MTNEIDFPSYELMTELANSNPEELERLREQYVNQLIESAPEQMQPKLRGMQFKVDMIRRKHKDSKLGSCVAISEMMLESLTELNKSLNGSLEVISEEPHQKASITNIHDHTTKKDLPTK